MQAVVSPAARSRTQGRGDEPGWPRLHATEAGTGQGRRSLPDAVERMSLGPVLEDFPDYGQGMDPVAVDVVRRFNRTVTQRVGALQSGYLARDRSLGASRVLWEIGPEGRE